MSDSSTAGSIGREYLAAARRRLEACHERLLHSLGQLDDRQVWWRPHESLNSVANIVLHVCGNLRQWIISGVGGAPDVRDRLAEFTERAPIPRDELLRRLGEVVREADAILAGLDEGALLRPRTIQGFDESVLSAIFDCVAHLGGHTQEVVYITRLQLGDAYRFAWIPGPEHGGAPAAETVPLRDAAFANLSAHPLESAATAGEGPLPGVDSGDRPAGPQHHVRELGQEFQ
jgi:hypothetical protein